MNKSQKIISSKDYEIEVLNETFKESNNIQVIEDKERNLVVLRIYGAIKEPEEYITEISKFEILSNMYDVVEITLNSPGGSLNTTVDLSSIIKKFNYVITIGKGEVASAAFMIWTMGDLKVVTDYSMYMAHRESYGMYGKTSEHKAAADIFGRVYEDMFESCFDSILTESEKIIADRSEAWVSYKDLLDRPGIISYDEYITPKNPYEIVEVYIAKEKMFMFDLETNAYRSVKIKFENDIISHMTDFLYGITDVFKIKTKKCKISNKKQKSKKNKKD